MPPGRQRRSYVPLPSSLTPSLCSKALWRARPTTTSGGEGIGPALISAIVSLTHWRKRWTNRCCLRVKTLSIPMSAWRAQIALRDSNIFSFFRSNGRKDRSPSVLRRMKIVSRAKMRSNTSAVGRHLEAIQPPRVLAQHHARQFHGARVGDEAVAQHGGEGAPERFAAVVRGDPAALLPAQFTGARIGVGGEHPFLRDARQPPPAGGGGRAGGRRGGCARRSSRSPPSPVPWRKDRRRWRTSLSPGRAPATRGAFRPAWQATARATARKNPDRHWASRAAVSSPS